MSVWSNMRLVVPGLCLFAVVLLATLRESHAGMTMAQIKQTAKMIRNVCRPKTGNVDIQILDDLANGIFMDGNHNLMCYVRCSFGMMQSVKNGRYNPDAAISSAKKLLPADMRDKVIEVVEKCRGSDQGIEDDCEAAYVVLKCTYNEEPEQFFFP